MNTLNSRDKKRITTTVIILILYFIGNRMGLYAQYLSKQGRNGLDIASNVFGDFFHSFKVLGLRIGFDLISILSGLTVILIAFFIITWQKMNKKNYRSGEEHGSARYGRIDEEASILKDEDEDKNMILSKNIQISMDTRKTFLNNNICAIGGSGSGKTRFFIKPNILQMSCNYVVTDPKLSLLPEVGNAFLQNGYDIKVIDLIHIENSMHYNPFNYIHRPLDVFKFINNLIENTSDKKQATGSDPFFEKAEASFLTALAFFVMACGDDDERNMNTVIELYFLAKASEEDESMSSPLDIMFEDLEEENKVKQEAMTPVDYMRENEYAELACLNYNIYKNAAGKTAKSILVSLGVRLYPFMLPEVSTLLGEDTIHLETIGNPKKDSDGNNIKTILFVGISDSDKSLNFIASIMYQQLFDLLYLQADSKNGKLPIHTRFMLDEFANIGRVPNFEILIATMRSREISVNVVLQNMAQLKEPYEKTWETIFGNCDTTLFLGGKEFSSLEYLSKMIGNGTFDYKSVSETRGSHPSSSISNQLINRALLDPAEIGRLRKDECLVHIRGEQIFRDTKFDLMTHKNIDLTVDASNRELAHRNYFDNTKIRGILEGALKKENSDSYISSQEDELENKIFKKIKKIYTRS